MEIKELTCIGCPLGCSLTVEIKDDGEMVVSGNTCPNGEKYAKKELTDPRRIVTSTIRVEGGSRPCISVKTKSDIPKGKILDCMKELSLVTAKAPIEIGDVVLSNVAGTGVDIVATKPVLLCGEAGETVSSEGVLQCKSI